MELPVDLARTVAAVLDEGSFEAAANALRVTPSAVSQRVKALEERLGRVVLVRAKPVRPTEAGAPIVRLARQIALLEHEALAELGSDAAAPARIGIAVNADSLATWFLDALSAVTSEHPVAFDLHREDQDDTAQLLESGRVMGAVTSRSVPVAGCRVSPLRIDRYRAVATPGFVERWFAGGVTRDALARAPHIVFDRRDELQAGFLASQGVTVTPPAHFIPASSEFAAAVRLGIGWAMLPDLQVGDGLESGRLVELLPGTESLVQLYWQQWNLRSDLLDLVAEAVASAARNR